jgi:hypothetical protein
MGFFETLNGWKKILSFEIIFDENDKVNVKVHKNVPIIKEPDYIRLWACYEAKMIYNLGFPSNLSSMMTVGFITKIAENGISANTECFKEVNVDDVIQFDPNVIKGNTKFTGEFYARGPLDRSIKTWLPLKGTEQQIVYSGLALMQYTISIIRDDKELQVMEFDIFTKTAKNMAELYKSGMRMGITSTVKIPTLAYWRAVGIGE